MLQVEEGLNIDVASELGPLEWWSVHVPTTVGAMGVKIAQAHIDTMNLKDGWSPVCAQAISSGVCGKMFQQNGN